MGWDIGENGFKIVLSAGVPDVVRQFVRDDVDSFLADQHLVLDDITSWVCHPGGPKVLEAFDQALELDDQALALTWRSLNDVGNLSSSSVLFVLRDTMDGGQVHPSGSTRACCMAMGPGFCSELVLHGMAERGCSKLPLSAWLIHGPRRRDRHRATGRGAGEPEPTRRPGASTHGGRRARCKAHYPFMVVLHTGFLVACVAEVWLLSAPVPRVACSGRCW